MHSLREYHANRMEFSHNKKNGSGDREASNISKVWNRFDHRSYLFSKKKIAKKKERGLGLIVLSGWKCLTKKNSFLISLLEFLINLILILIIWHSESSIQIVRWFLYFFLFQSFTFAMGLSCKKTSVRVLVWIEIVIEIFKFSISLIFNDYRGPRVRSCIIFTIIDDMPNFFSRPKGSVQFRHCPFLSSNWNLSSRRKLKLSKFKRFSSK